MAVDTGKIQTMQDFPVCQVINYKPEIVMKYSNALFARSQSSRIIQKWTVGPKGCFFRKRRRNHRQLTLHGNTLIRIKHIHCYRVFAIVCASAFCSGCDPGCVTLPKRTSVVPGNISRIRAAVNDLISFISRQRSIRLGCTACPIGTALL